MVKHPKQFKVDYIDFEGQEKSFFIWSYTGVIAFGTAYKAQGVKEVIRVEEVYHKIN